MKSEKRVPPPSHQLITLYSIFFIQMLRYCEKLKHLKKNFFEWISGTTNKMDLLSLIVSIVAVITRYTVPQEYFQAVYALFSLLFILNVIKCSQLFYVHKELGTKINMLYEMVSYVHYAEVYKLNLSVSNVATREIVISCCPRQT